MDHSGEPPFHFCILCSTAPSSSSHCVSSPLDFEYRLSPSRLEWQLLPVNTYGRLESLFRVLLLAGVRVPTTIASLPLSASLFICRDCSRVTLFAINFLSLISLKIKLCSPRVFLFCFCRPIQVFRFCDRRFLIGVVPDSVQQYSALGFLWNF